MTEEASGLAAKLDPQPPPAPPASRPKATKLAAASLPTVLRLFWAGSLIAFGLMFLIAWLTARASVPHEGWRPLGAPFPFLGDLLENAPTFRLVHTQAFWHGALAPAIAYPPFGGVVLGLFYASGHPGLLYMSLGLSSLLPACWLVRRALLERGIQTWTATLFPLTIAAASFPIEGLLQRGNLELVVWILAGLGAWMFLRGHEHRAAIFWGLAAAVKLYPIVLLILFWPRRRFRPALLGVASFLVATAGSLLYLGPTLRSAWLGWTGDLFGYQHKRAAFWNLTELAENHSFFTWVKAVAIVAHHPPDGLIPTYYVCGGLLFGLLYFGRLGKLPVPNQLLGVTAFMLLLPTISAFYTLVHLYAPLLVLIFLALEADRARVRVPGLNFSILLFVPICACYTLFTFRSVLLFGGLLQGGCLVVLLLCSLEYAFTLPLPMIPARE